jgi:hypothetical protein
LLTRGLATGRLTSSLLGTSHCFVLWNDASTPRFPRVHTRSTEARVRHDVSTFHGSQTRNLRF